ncbi:MAG TPA: hypothetical protein VFY20_04490 [Gemmatimonadales bacterium]|nr:hypothetical protein [Gemmatimonadales bacterium]
MTDQYEASQRDLDPHRAEEQRSARLETEDRLASRGIVVRRDDDDIELADLLDTVEQFEDMVEARGGDLMVDHIGSDRPDDPAFVLPPRRAGESVPAYRIRVLEALDRLQTPPTG